MNPDDLPGDCGPLTSHEIHVREVTRPSQIETAVSFAVFTATVLGAITWIPWICHMLAIWFGG